MAEYDRYGGSRQKKKSSGMFAPLAFILVVAVLVFMIGIFFRVQNIQVVGAGYYSDAEIIDASGVENGDNLFFINGFSASSSILSKLPFVDGASLERKMPNTIVLTVQESKAVAYVDWQEQHWMLTAGGKLLGSASGEELAGLVHVKNLAPLSPVTGETMTVEDADSLMLRYMLSLLDCLASNGLVGSVSEADMQNVANVQIRYTERFSVKLGANEQLDQKLRMMLAAAAQLDPSETAMLDISDGETVYVSPD